jgi:hypothetical protein
LRVVVVSRAVDHVNCARGNIAFANMESDMTKLYDVFSVRNEAIDETYLMTAPMMVVAAAFNLPREAAKRVEFELGNNVPFSSVHFNSRRSILNLDQILIMNHNNTGRVHKRNLTADAMKDTHMPKWANEEH